MRLARLALISLAMPRRLLPMLTMSMMVTRRRRIAYLSCRSSACGRTPGVHGACDESKLSWRCYAKLTAQSRRSVALVRHSEGTAARRPGGHGRFVPCDPLVGAEPGREIRHRDRRHGRDRYLDLERTVLASDHSIGGAAVGMRFRHSWDMGRASPDCADYVWWPIRLRGQDFARRRGRQDVPAVALCRCP